ncbi:MAG: hypothetical protein ACXQS8_08755 [Candidatus Helarchaeales archaeon]
MIIKINLKKNDNTNLEGIIKTLAIFNNESSAIHVIPYTNTIKISGIVIKHLDPEPILRILDLTDSGTVTIINPKLEFLYIVKNRALTLDYNGSVYNNCSFNELEAMLEDFLA